MSLQDNAWRIGTVVEARSVAVDVRRVVIESEQPSRAEAGAHVDIGVPIRNTIATRSYSVVDSDSDGRLLAISVLRSPTSRGGSRYMHSLGEDQRIRMRGPLQNFPLRFGARRYLLLAGGIGVTAIAPMARQLRDTDADYRMVYTGRSRAAMAYLDELAAIHRDRLVVHLSGDSGRLAIGEVLAAADDSTELYMCGPLDLMRDVRRHWVQRSLPMANLRYETFGDTGAAGGFVVKVPRLGVETVVEPGETLLDALESTGVEVMADCLKGECGLCEVDVLGLTGVIDHRDVFYSREQQHTGLRMCSCVSRVAPLPSDLAGDRAVPEVVIDVRSAVGERS